MTRVEIPLVNGNTPLACGRCAANDGHFGCNQEKLDGIRHIRPMSCPLIIANNNGADKIATTKLMEARLKFLGRK